MFKDLLQSRNATGAIECTLIVGFLLLAIIVAAAELRHQVDTVYGQSEQHSTIRPD